MNELWEKLHNFKVSKGNEELTFTGRLSLENGWNKAYAERVYREYLRFIYLAITADHSVTPSEDVDQVWHLHLCYTRSYWQDLCEGVLEKALHHGPTKGGKQEDIRFHDQYLKTLDSYQHAFGEVPPDDIWPKCGQRFRRGDRFVRVNLRESLVVPKKSLYVAVLIALTAIVVSGCEELIAESLTLGDPSGMIAMMVVIFSITVVALILKHGGGGRGGGKHGGGGCGGSSSCGGDNCGGNDSGGSSCGGGGCGGGD